jgi:hypothetical protein
MYNQYINTYFICMGVKYTKQTLYFQEITRPIFNQTSKALLHISPPCESELLVHYRGASSVELYKAGFNIQQYCEK